MDYAVQDIKASENLVQAETHARAPIKGLKETTHGYKKNETKRMISRAN